MKLRPIAEAKRDGSRILLVYRDRLVTGKWTKGAAKRKLDGKVYLDPYGDGFWLPDDWATSGALKAAVTPPTGFYELPELGEHEVLKMDDDYERGVAAGGG